MRTGAFASVGRPHNMLNGIVRSRTGLRARGSRQGVNSPPPNLTPCRRMHRVISNVLTRTRCRCRDVRGPTAAADPRALLG